jgi:hypothetical protein
MKTDDIHLMKRLLKIKKRGSERTTRKYRYWKKVRQSLPGDMRAIIDLRILPTGNWRCHRVEFNLLSGCLGTIPFSGGFWVFPSQEAPQSLTVRWLIGVSRRLSMKVSRHLGIWLSRGRSPSGLACGQGFPLAGSTVALPTLNDTIRHPRAHSGNGCHSSHKVHYPPSTPFRILRLATCSVGVPCAQRPSVG